MLFARIVATWGSLERLSDRVNARSLRNPSSSLGNARMCAARFVAYPFSATESLALSMKMRERSILLKEACPFNFLLDSGAASKITWELVPPIKL